MNSLASLLLLFVGTSLLLVEGFVVVQPSSRYDFRKWSLQATNIELSLEKPLGIILEEVEEGKPMGVVVESIADGGSAATSGYANELIGLKVATVMGVDVRSYGFDNVMDLLIQSPSPLSIEFEPLSKSEANTDSSEGTYKVGTVVDLKVIQEGKPDVVIQGRVGDNLRQTLLANDVEVYRTFKKKVGNCGGGGTCGFCAVEFEDDEAWAERSDWEDKKVGRISDSARLACMNSIQGPATIRTLK